MKTIYVVFKTARQIDGEYVFVSAEKAFSDPKQAEQYWREQSRVWREEVVVPGVVPGAVGERIPCECERAIHPVELTD